MNYKLEQILLSGKIGDGCIYKNNKEQKDYNFSFVSKNLDYLMFRKNIFETEGIETSRVKKSYSGFKKDSYSYGFATYQDNRITKVANMTIIEVLNKLDKLGLSLYYLDDGTFHQKKHFGHIYCNSFSENEVTKLIDVIYEMYPIKKSTKRIDRKRDGREYPYIYIPVPTMKGIIKDVEEFILDEKIYSMLYKVGK